MMSNGISGPRFAAIAGVAAVLALALVFVVQSCSGGDELAVPLFDDEVRRPSRTSTIAPTTTGSATFTPIALTTTTVQPSPSTTTTAPAITTEELAVIVAETNPPPEVELIDGPSDVDGPATPDVGPTPLPPSLATEPVAVTTPPTTTTTPADDTTTTTTAPEPEAEAAAADPADPRGF